MPMLFKMYDEGGNVLFDLNATPILRLKETITIDYEANYMVHLSGGNRRYPKQGLQPGRHISNIGVVVANGIVISQYGGRNTRYFTIDIYEF